VEENLRDKGLKREIRFASIVQVQVYLITFSSWITGSRRFAGHVCRSGSACAFALLVMLFSSFLAVLLLTTLVAAADLYKTLDCAFSNNNSFSVNALPQCTSPVTIETLDSHTRDSAKSSIQIKTRIHQRRISL
jgi:hypothetical protein